MTPSKSGLRLEMPIDDVINYTPDLDYVNRSLVSSGFSQTRVGMVSARQVQISTPTIKHPIPSSAVIQSVESATSPDSNVPCRSPDCPIKGIAHNLGRYFHDGEQSWDPEALGPDDNLGGFMEDIRNAFNRTKPPPEVITAYLMMRRDVATQEEIKIVRQYQKHHMWSPLISEPVTPWPREQYPEKHGLFGESPLMIATNLPSIPEKHGLFGEPHLPIVTGEVSKWADSRVERSIAQDYSSDIAKSSGSIGLFDRGFAARPIQASDFDDSDDDEDEVPSPLVRNGEIGDLAQPLLAQGSTCKNEEQYYGEDTSNDDIPTGATRKIPEGRELMSDRLQIQEKILRKIAADQCLRKAENRTIGNRCPEDNGDDVALEILLKLMEALPQALRDGGLQSLVPGSEHENNGFSDTEYEILRDVQAMLRKILADVMCRAKRPYEPTGRPVTASEVQTELAAVLSERQAWLDGNPGKTITEMIEQLSQESENLHPVLRQRWRAWFFGKEE